MSALRQYDGLVGRFLFFVAGGFFNELQFRLVVRCRRFGGGRGVGRFRFSLLDRWLWFRILAAHENPGCQKERHSRNDD